MTKIFISRKAWVVLLLGVSLGTPLGVSTATFLYADGFSYFSGNPKACMNCHIMRPHYDAWSGSTHRSVATCNDCHTSGSFFSKYSQKAVNGLLHSWAFTTDNFHEPIQIKDFNRKIATKSCLNCHSNLIETSHFGAVGFGKNQCLNCHKDVGHRRW